MGSDGYASSTNKIPPGYRVVSVRVDAVTGASGLILPNDRVDVLVYLARNPATGINETSTKTILQDVRVFAVDTQFERKQGHDEPAIAAKTISLLVTPAQAEKVTLATEMGTIRLIMRSPDDSTDAMAGGASIRDIFSETNKTDRANEELQAPPVQPKADALSWLEQQKQAASAAAAQPAVPPRPQTWTMTLLEGSEIRQVELNNEAQFPSVVEPQNDDASDSKTEEDPPAESAADTPDAKAPDANAPDDELPPQSEAEDSQGK